MVCCHGLHSAFHQQVLIFFLGEELKEFAVGREPLDRFEHPWNKISFYKVQNGTGPGFQSLPHHQRTQVTTPILELLTVVGEELVVAGSDQSCSHFAKLIGACAAISDQNGVGEGHQHRPSNLQSLLDDRVEDYDADLLLRIALVILDDSFLKELDQLFLSHDRVVGSLTLGLSIEELINLAVFWEDRAFSAEGPRCDVFNHVV